MVSIRPDARAMFIPVENVAGVRTRQIPELPLPHLPGAACKGMVTDPENDLFFPGMGGGGRRQRDRAIAICNGCPIKDRCLQEALDWDRAHPDYYDRTQGIWGGTTEAQRKAILRGENAA